MLMCIGLYESEDRKAFDCSMYSLAQEEPIALTAEKEYEQTFSSESGSLESIKIGFENVDEGNKGNVTVVLKKNNDVIQSWKTSLTDLRKNQVHTFKLNNPAELDEGDYTLSITCDKTADSQASIYLNHSSIPDEWSLTADGEKMEGSAICFEEELYDTAGMKKASRIGLILILLVSAMCLFKIKEPVTMLVSVLIAGICFYIVFPRYNFPDFADQFSRSLEVSMGNFLSLKNVDGIGGSGNFFPSNLLNIQNGGEELDWSNKTAYVFSNLSLYSPVSYFPSALGMKIARMFSNNNLTIFNGGMIGNFIATSILYAYALFQIPYGRKLLYVLMLMPSSLQNMITVAPDGVTTGLCFALIACVLNMKEKKTGISRWNIAVLAILCILLSQYKIVYIVMIFLVYLIPKEQFSSTRQRRIVRLWIPLLAVTCNLLWLLVSTNYLNNTQSMIAGVRPKEQMIYVLTHIPTYCKIAFNTLFTNFNNWTQMFVGKEIGKFNIPISSLVYESMLVISIAIVCINHDVPYHGWKDILWTLLVFLAVCALIFTSLYIQWTPYKDSLIIGIQGRYFIPIMPLLSLSVISVRNGFRKNDSTYRIEASALIILMFSLSLMACLSIISFHTPA